MEKDPFGNLSDRSHIFEDEDGDPFAGLYSLPAHNAPMPPRRPADIAPKAATTTDAATAGMRWSDVPKEALRNAWPSAVNAAEGMVSPILHPQDTWEAVKGLGKGLVSKGKGALGYERNPEDEKTVDALKQLYVDRYGSEEGWKNSIAKDPFGVAADVSSLVGGGGAAIARLPGKAGKLGSAIETVGRAANPFNAAATVAAPAMLPAQALLNVPLSIKSGAPLASLNRAMKAGFRGSDAFLDQLSGGDPAQIVNKAHAAVSKIAEKRRADYLSGMAGVATGTTPIDYTDINNALRDALKDVTHGSKTYKREAGDMLRELSNEILGWQRMPNTPTVNYHNVEGVDKLKQLVGEIRSNAKPGSPADAVATKIYNSIRDTLGKHDPNYLKVMENYGDLSDQLKQLKVTLSVNPKASVDTTLRKILLGDKQKDGSKGKLLSQLAKEDPEIANMVAGHLLSSWVPTGLTGTIGAALSAAHGYGAYSGALGPYGAIAGALASSPRLVGALNYGVGNMAHPGGGLPVLATAPLNLLNSAKEPPAPRASEERPYFGDDVEPARPGRATGGRTGGPSPERLITMANASRRKIQARSKEILKQPDEHVVRALKAVNQEMQG